MLRLLAHPTYNRLFAAQVLSLLGTGLTTVALGLLAYELAGEQAGVVLGTALMLKMIAYVGVAPVASALGAHLPRRALLVGLDLCRALVVLLLPFVDQIWQIYLLVFVLQFFSAAFTPAFQATIPDVLSDEEDYTAALSLSRLAYDLESLLSPLLAGLLLSLISFHWLFTGTTLGFLASALLVLSVSLPPIKHNSETEPFLRRLTHGIRIYLATPRLRGLLALNFAVSAVGAMVIVNTVVYVKAVLGGSEQTYTTVLMAYGLGSMLVAVILPRLLGTLSTRRMMLSGVWLLAAAASLVIFGPPLYAVGLIWLLMGAGSALVMTPGGLLLRRSAQPEDRVALFSAQFALSHAGWLITYPLAGWLGTVVGLGSAFLIMAAVTLTGGFIALRLWPPSADSLEQEHEHPPLAHEHLHVHDEHHQHEHEGWEGPEPHRHPHRHRPLRHRHVFVIDAHHPIWPR